MSWNYRVVRREQDGETWYGIYEVFYEDDVPFAVTQDSMAPFGVSVEELRSDAECMLEAFELPVLDYEDFRPGGKYYKPADEIYGY